MLAISHLSKTYQNGVKALNDVTLNIDRGLFGLLGPNGAGKSTLMRTIATLQEADSGTITFDGENVSADPRLLRGKLGYLPQTFGVYPRIPAIELLDYLAILKGVGEQRKEQIESLLNLTNLWDVRKRAVSTFSGGMRQRFGIAQALLGDPKLVIVDEPTAGLDPEERNRFHNLLSEIGENVVVILSTHIVEDVSDLCSNMAIISGGRVLMQGEPLEAIRKLEGKIWRRVIAKGELDAFQQEHAVISTKLVAGRTRVRVLADEHPGNGFGAVQAGLQDVYFSSLALARRAA